MKNIIRKLFFLVAQGICFFCWPIETFSLVGIGKSKIFQRNIIKELFEKFRKEWLQSNIFKEFILPVGGLGSVSSLLTLQKMNYSERTFSFLMVQGIFSSFLAYEKVTYFGGQNIFSQVGLGKSFSSLAQEEVIYSPKEYFYRTFSPYQCKKSKQFQKNIIKEFFFLVGIRKFFRFIATKK